MKYYLKHKYLNSDSTMNYLKYDAYLDSFYLDVRCSNKTRFTENEIKRIKQKFNSTLDDFNIIEAD